MEIIIDILLQTPSKRMPVIWSPRSLWDRIPIEGEDSFCQFVFIHIHNFFLTIVHSLSLCFLDVGRYRWSSPWVGRTKRRSQAYKQWAGDWFNLSLYTMTALHFGHLASPLWLSWWILLCCFFLASLSLKKYDFSIFLRVWVLVCNKYAGGYHPGLVHTIQSAQTTVI